MLDKDTLCSHQKYSTWRAREERTSQPPQIVVETVDGIQVERVTLPVTQLSLWVPDDTVIDLMNTLNSSDPKADWQRRNISFSLNNNSSNKNEHISHERAVSAYFTYNPQDETIIVEWGTTDPNNQNAKLHTYLNKMIDHRKRKEQGMKISSGHIAKVSGANGSKHYLAFFDRLIVETQPLTRNSDLGKVINTLYAYGFIPLTTDGFVQLPAFLS